MESKFLNVFDIVTGLDGLSLQDCRKKYLLQKKIGWYFCWAYVEFLRYKTSKKAHPCSNFLCIYLFASYVNELPEMIYRHFDFC
jgi:hypothetical protein